MLRKSGLSQLKKFKKFINKQGGDISKKLNDKTVTNTLDKHIETSDDQKNANTKTDKQLKNLSKKSIINKANENSGGFLSDEEIESQFDNFTISEIKVEKIHDDSGASGFIEIYYPSSNEYVVDNWIKYRSQFPHLNRNTNDAKIAFDHWFPEKMSNKLKKIIEKEIKKEKIRRDSEKYNL